MNVERVALVAALLLVAGCLVITLCLVLARLIKDHAERRHWGDIQRAGFDQT
jgi:hypothetical protein